MSAGEQTFTIVVEAVAGSEDQQVAGDDIQLEIRSPMQDEAEEPLLMLTASVNNNIMIPAVEPKVWLRFLPWIGR